MANTPQNPLSYVGQNNAGAATILPSTPFNPQQFFSELIGEKKAEAQLELKKRETAQQHNMSWFDKASKYNKDYWAEEAGVIEEKASTILDDLSEMVLNADAEGRLINYSERAKANQMMSDLNNEIVNSRKRQAEVTAIIKMAKETKDVRYDDYGLELMMQDVRDGTYSLEKMNTHYLLPEKKYIDEDIIQNIANLFGTVKTTQGNKNVTQVNPKSIKAVRDILESPISSINRHINNLVKDGVIDDTPEAKKAYFEKLFNTAIQSINTGSTQRQSLTINMGGATPSAPQEGGWLFKPDLGAKYIPKTSTSGRVQESPIAASLSIASRFSGGVKSDQATIDLQDISILPTAATDITYKTSNGIKTIRKGKELTKSQLEIIKNRDNVEDLILFAPYIVGDQGKDNPIIMEYTKQTHSWLAEGSKEKKGQKFWGGNEWNDIQSVVKDINENKMDYL